MRRDAALGGRRRRHVFVVVAAIGLAAIGVAHLRDWIDTGRHHAFGSDFALFYAFAKVGLQYGFSHLYDPQAQHAVQASLGPLPWFPAPYPPLVAWLVAPLTALPLTTAYWIWSALMAAALVTTCMIIAPRGIWWKLAVLGLFLWPECVVFALRLGQFVVFQMLGVAACWWFVKRGRPVAAGLALVPIALHPQGLFLLPLVLLVAGHRRLFTTWALSLLVLGAASIVVVGPHGMATGLHRVIQVWHSPSAWAGDPRYEFPQWAAQLGIPALVVQLFIVSFGLAAGRRMRKAPVELLITMGIGCSILCTSFMHSQDLSIILIGVFLAMRTPIRARLYVPAVALYAVLVASPHLSLYGRAVGGLPVVALELAWLAALWRSTSEYAVVPVGLQRRLRRWRRAANAEPVAEAGAG